MLRFAFAGWLAMAAMVTAAGAQQEITLQLPTFNFTTVSTSVSVPDGGRALLGGIARASEGSTTRGLPMLSKIPGVNRAFRNQGIGRDVGLMNMSVEARIIDLAEEELRQTGYSPELSESETSAAAAIVGRTGFGGRSDEQLAVARKAAFLTRHVARPSAELESLENDTGLPSLAEIRRQNEATLAKRAAEADKYYAAARRAEAEGKAGVAKIYYQMALRRADAPLQQAIASRVNAISPR